MSKAKNKFSRPLTVLLSSVCCTVVGLPLLLADGTAPAGSTVTPAAVTGTSGTEPAMINLIRRLAERGAITEADAAELTKLAEADAADAHVQAALTALAAAQADAAQKRSEAVALQASNGKNISNKTTSNQGGIVPVAAAVVGATTAAAVSDSSSVNIPTETGKSAAGAGGAVVGATAVGAAAVAGLPDDGTVRVTYVPESVKAQMREDIKNDVMEQARKERWASPRAFPEWVSRFTFYGDFRLRFESYRPNQQNDAFVGNTNFWNYNAINTGAPYDVSVSNPANPPIINTDQDRNRLRVRARLGAVIDLGEGFTTGLRIATGENGSPVSQNQTLGGAGSGQGGNFSKYAIWLDRAYLKYQSQADLSRAFTATIGRMENPLLCTSIIWADDLGFDGAVITIPTQIHYDGRVVDSVKPYFVLGAFPVFNTDINYSSNWPDKYKSNDKWLEAAQLGIDLKLSRDLKMKLGVAYYYFTKTVGKLSSPYTPLTNSDGGDTDARRPAFAQKGNTYMWLRDIVPDATNAYGQTNQWQYFGFASEFRDLAIDIRADYNHFEPFQISFIGEYIKNTGFDEASIKSRLPFNNLGATTTEFVGGDTAWITGLKVGHAILQQRWDWNAIINYRIVESDSVIDGFCDSDFGGGGTNVKGLTLGGNVALAKRVSLGARWMSSSQVEGPTYKNDILQIDINAKF